MAHIDLNDLDEMQVNTVHILREFGTAKVYLHNDQQEGLVSAKAVEVLEAKGYVELLPPADMRSDPRRLMRARIKPGVEDMGEKFKVTLHESWCMKDASAPKGNRSLDIYVPPGTYTMVRVPNVINPLMPAPWLVIEGTKIGQAEGSLRQWEDDGLTIEPCVHDGLMVAAKMYGLRLSDYQNGEDVTGMKAKLAQLQAGPVSLDDAMAVITALAEREDLENLKPWQQEMVAVMREAKRIAYLYSRTDDGGTCNMDTAVLWPNKTWQESQILEVAEVSGVSLSVSTWMRRRCVFVHIHEGQGYRRTKMAEVVTAHLKQVGYESSIYYQMD